ncbi:MAG: phytanoyl-CoA dioxygenase family protein [Streptosporangiaceae bacterium]
MPLTVEELTTFASQGMLIRRGLIAHKLAVRARTLAEDWYEHEMKLAELVAYTQRTFAPEHGSHPDLLALFYSSDVVDLVTSLVGEFQPVTAAQVQIRIPERDLTQTQPEKAMHVDGVACPHLDPSELRTFSLLVGVVLSDVTSPQGGALRYVPGGHLYMAEWFRSEWSLGLTDQVPPQLDAEQGTPFLGHTGDVLMMHHLVPHAVGRNHTERPRLMAYFRVSHVNHPSRRLEALKDPWLDYPTIARLQRESQAGP